MFKDPTLLLLIIITGKEEEGVVPQQDNHVDLSIIRRRRPVRFCDNGNSCNGDPTSCSMRMIGIMNLFFLYHGIKKKKEEGYPSWNEFIDTTLMDMARMAVAVVVAVVVEVVEKIVV